MFFIKVMLATVAILCFVGVVAATSHATTRVLGPDGWAVQPYQRWANHTKLPSPKVVVSLTLDADRMFTPCPDYAEACAVRSSVWVWSGSKRTVWLHELGHVVDDQLMTDPDRDAFRRLIGDENPWHADIADSPHERFAEAYSFCARTGVRNLAPYAEWESLYGYDPSSPAHKRVCRLIANLSHR